MKTKSFLLAIAMISCLVGFAHADSPWSSTYWWHTMSQAQRNSAIVSRANYDLNQWSGLSCKNWVRKVVYEASGNHVTIPSNQPFPNDYLWQYDATGQVIGMSMPIENVVPGYIIQMCAIYHYPHTAIVKEKTSTHVTLIKSNWDSTPENDADARVTERSLAFSEFYGMLESSGSFSVYLIQ